MRAGQSNSSGTILRSGRPGVRTDTVMRRRCRPTDLRGGTRRILNSIQRAFASRPLISAGRPRRQNSGARRAFIFVSCEVISIAAFRSLVLSTRNVAMEFPSYAEIEHRRYGRASD